MSAESDLTVVLGARRYRVERPWGDLPSGLSFSGVSHVAVDPEDCVYVYQRSDPPVVVLAPDGSYLRAWGSGRIADAHGIFIARDGRIFLVDRDAHEVVIFSAEGKEVGVLGDRHCPNFAAPFNHPTGLAVAGDGEIYVSDGYGNSVVHRFAPDGRHLASWGRPGAGPGEFTTPHAVWVDRRDRVLVADRENNRIQAFDRDGRFLEAWGDLYHPMDICEDDRGGILVTDQIPRLSLLSPAGELRGRCRAVWVGAHGVAVNAGGDIFLAEIQPSRITRLSVIEG